MKFFLFCFFSVSLFASESDLFYSEQDIVIAQKRIVFNEFPGAFNPSLIKFDQGYLLSFRYSLSNNCSISYIGVALLNDAFEPISPPELLATRHRYSTTPSQSEDARFFSYRGRIFLIYNDNVDVTIPSIYERRDIFIAEIICVNSQFYLCPPLKLCCEVKGYQLWQKNWVPFEYDQNLYFGYTMVPQEILSLNFTNGKCYPKFLTEDEISWDYGILRGSSQATLVDGKYLAFFHSGTVIASPASYGHEAWHYFMGAYTFSAKPPFEILEISPRPISADTFYEPSSSWKKVIFPGGYVVNGSHIYVAYGKNDCELWIATLDKEALFRSFQKRSTL